jgi:hypothetical protein
MMVWNPGRDHPMNHRTLAGGVSGVALAILVAGCAGPGTGSLASRPVPLILFGPAGSPGRGTASSDGSASLSTRTRP